MGHLKVAAFLSAALVVAGFVAPTKVGGACLSPVDGTECCVGSNGLSATFNGSNELQRIVIGDAEFATGGGSLWSATFAASANPAEQIMVSAGDAEGFSRGESCGVDTLFWRNIPLGGERGVLDAKVLMESRPDDPAAFCALQTRELLWGNSLGWFLHDILDRPDKCAILKRLCEFRQQHLDVLAYGNLLDELRIVSPVGSTTYEWLGRRPHFRLFDKTYKLPPSKFATMPDVIGNWWHAADGKVVLLAANLADRPQTVKYRVYGTDDTAEMTFSPHELRRVQGSKPEL